MHLSPARSRTPSAGPRQVILRYAVLALLAALAFAGTSTGSARAADGDVTWTVRTAANGYGDDRSSFSYGVNPGSQVKDAMVVANHSKNTLTLALYAADGYTTEKGQLDLLTREKKSLGIGAWVRAGKESVRIAPGRTAEIPFTVAVPRNATPGDYVGGILTSLKQSDDTEGIAVDRRLGIRIELRVSGALKPTLAVEDLHVDHHGTANPFGQGDATVTYTLHNTGNALLSGTQKVTLTGPFGTLETHAGTIAAAPELLPGESWKVTVPVHDVTPALRLTARATVTPALTDAAGSTTSLKPVEATTTGWAIPWTLILLIAVLPAATTAAYLLRRRNRDRRKQREDARVRDAVEQALQDRTHGTQDTHDAQDTDDTQDARATRSLRGVLVVPPPEVG
ncbi:WxL protein peptidoglycan domain-containing protein [Streptomyces sp. NPDC017991]|uniref:WxL protein peptidoglycan domain-containing protein n=1 Tax=Streptomyces sp. NPDC017991 TaxID=3365026 RepID=UPI0037921B6B